MWTAFLNSFFSLLFMTSKQDLLTFKRLSEIPQSGVRKTAPASAIMLHGCCAGALERLTAKFLASEIV